MAPFASDAEAGLVYVVRGPWTEGFLHRINRFPEKPNDDGDATSGGHAALTEKRSSFSDYYGKQEEASA
jgi:phage terminase large subunit-like protein